MKNIFTLALTALTFAAYAQPDTDPQSCYEPNSAVYDCTMIGVDDGYEDGYNDGLAACTTDTVYVNISNDEYYLNTISLLDSALTIYVNLYNETAQENATLQSELALVEDEVMYWMEAYNDAVTCANDYIDQLEEQLNGCEETVLYLDSLYDDTMLQLNATKLELEDCTDAVEWNFNLVQDLTAQVDACQTSYAFLEELFEECANGLPVITGYYNLYGAPVDPATFNGIIIATFSDGTSIKYTR